MPSLQCGGRPLPHPADIFSDALSAVIGGGQGVTGEHAAVVPARLGGRGQQQEKLPDKVTSKLRPEAGSG